MVRLTVALRAPAHRAEDLLEALRFLRGGTLLEPGCLRCCVWVDPDSTVQFVEEWATEADLRRHVRSERFTSLLAVLETAPERPHIQFDFVTSTRGLEYIAELRHDLESGEGRPA
jgi:quinol monooxygenase YgiN